MCGTASSFTAAVAGGEFDGTATFVPAFVPEPSSLPVLAAALVIFFLARRERFRIGTKAVLAGQLGHEAARERNRAAVLEKLAPQRREAVLGFRR